MLTAGIDEAGRGPLAGPVVAAAVIFPKGKKIPEAITDSKKLSEAKREELYEIIIREFIYGVGIVSEKEIDKINILQASFLAMRRAIRGVKIAPDYIILDGKFKIPKLDKPQTAIISGDAKVFCVAAASIIAKVSRDYLMDEFAKKYPQYDFAKHKGYGTKLHFSKINEHGPCPIHRFSFAPIKEMVIKKST